MAGFRKLPGIEEVIWGGRHYRRVPEHKDRHRRVYFMATTAPRSYLHRDVYEAERGPIPGGWHVHHKDHDPLNNDAANLEAISEPDHLAHHAEHRTGYVRLCDECDEEYVAEQPWGRWCSPRCKERRRRADGVAFVKPLKGSYGVERQCDSTDCGKAFTARRPWARFCTPACKQRQARRDARSA